MIIVYHTEEKKGIPHITVLFEKGFDNIFQLTGGQDEFQTSYPEIVEGQNIPYIEKKESKDFPLSNT